MAVLKHISAASESHGALVRERPLTDANPNLRDPAIYTDRDVRFREYICPRSGRLLQTEIVVDGEEPLWDLRPGDVIGPAASGASS